MNGGVKDPEAMAKRVEEIRYVAIFEDDGVRLSPTAEQEYLLAVAALEQAQRYFTLAHLHR